MSGYSNNKGMPIEYLEEKPSRYKIYSDALCYAMTICLGLCMITGNRIFSFAIIGLSVMCIFTVEAIIPVEFMLFLAPILFDSGLSIGIDKIVFLIITAGQLIQVVFVHRRLTNSRYLGLSVWLILAVIASGMHSRFNQPWGTVSILIVDIITFILYSQICITKQQAVELLDRFANVCLVMMLFFAVQSVLHPTSVDNRLTVAEELNINHFAMTISQISIYLLAYAMLAKNRRIKILCIAIYVVGCAMLLFTGTRSSTIAIVCSSFIVYLIASKDSGKQQKIQKVILLALVVLVLAVVFNSILSSNEFLRERFTISNLFSSSGSGRFPSLITEFTKIIPDNLWLGVGPSAYAEVDAVYQYGRWFFSAHNIIGSMLTQLGLIGSVPIVIITINIVKRLKHFSIFNNKFLLPLGLVVVCLINGIGEQIFNSRMFWFDLGFAVLLLNSLPCDLKER